MKLAQRIRRMLMKLKGKDPDFISVVLLLRKPLAISQNALEEAVRRAWSPKPATDEQDNFVVMNPPVVLVKAQGSLFNICAVPQPYINSVQEFASGIKDLRIKDAVLQHKAWISVDYVPGQRPVETDTDSQYAQAAKLAAELVNEDCLGICLPGEEVIVASSLSVVEGLRNFRTAREFSELYRPDPVLDLTKEFEAKAKAEARRRLPEFVKAFEARKNGEKFFLKCRFEDGEHTEWMWVEISSAEGDRYFGLLQNDPLWIKQIARGDGVQVEREDIEDWIYSTGGKAVGGFSTPKNPDDLA